MTATILETEIAAQPAVIEALLRAEAEPVAQLARELRGRFSWVLIAARGSSDNAARYAQYLFGAYNRVQVALATPSLFTLYDRPPNLSGALVIGVSQSGQSPDIVAVLAEAQRQGCPTVALTNDPASPLAGAATAVIGLHTGPELAVAATKTYTASLAGLGLLSVELADDSARRAELAHLPQMMAAALELSVPALARVERYRYMEGCTVIGRGFNYATAFEVALKIKELTRTIAEPYSSADFRHGPIALVLDGFPVILIAPRGRVEADVQALAADLRQRGGELVVISDDATLLATGQLALALPEGTPEWLSPLTAVLPGQQFARLLAEARGLNVDQPVGITKVTETR